MRFHMSGIDHLRIGGSAVPSQLAEYVLQDPTRCPANKPIIDRRWRTIFGWTIAPAATAFEYMHDAADNLPIVHSINPSHIRRQMRLDPLPLLTTQPKQVLAHDPDPLQKTNQDRIVRTQELMSSDPSSFDKMVLAHGVGDEDRQEPRDEKGNRSAGGSVGRHHASHMG